MRAPSTVTSPLAGVTRPAATLSSEVLPHPERPTSTTKSLLATLIEARSTAGLAWPS